MSSSSTTTCTAHTDHLISTRPPEKREEGVRVRVDDGVTEEFTQPGGRYPDDSVSWTYDNAGARDVSLTTYWKASFTVDGEGPFAVPGPEITKTAGPLTVPVREARSVLVGG